MQNALCLNWFLSTGTACKSYIVRYQVPNTYRLNFRQHIWQYVMAAKQCTYHQNAYRTAKRVENAAWHVQNDDINVSYTGLPLSV